MIAFILVAFIWVGPVGSMTLKPFAFAFDSMPECRARLNDLYHDAWLEPRTLAAGCFEQREV